MRTLTEICLLCVLAVSVVGCGGQIEDAGHWVGSFVDRISGPAAQDLVTDAIGNPDPDVRREAVIKLSSNNWGLREPYLKGYAWIVESEIVKRRNRNPTLICAAVGALGRAGDAKYLPVLVLALSDPSPQVRWDAAVALDNVTGDKAVEPLRNASLADTSVDVREAVCRAMRHYKRQDVVDTLIHCLGDREFAVRYRAHQTLVALCRRDFGPNETDWVGTKLDKLPPVQPDNGKSMWNPLNWFR